ncbi:hypothetical protein SteCoe_18830 [Stentor coeruleus]|uniref:Kinesin motor domain-containing protein n=1 Tax=Stentor coeruleus TaxID=5963 RepID=A0A1R2BVK8_9CILI|nr:hypothetical protein SteCoe_18830 [Stentor coeruleus]
MEYLKSRESSESNIKVIARFRPLINIEKELTESKELELKFLNEFTVGIPKMMDEYETFSFDRVFNSNASQEEIFDFVGRPIIQEVLTGYNGTVFAYGQTGSGKTYTMMGSNVHDFECRGIIPRSTSLIFQSLAQSSTQTEFTIKCSMLEIYKETLKDLLGNSGELKIKQDKRKGIFIEGLTDVYVVCEEEMLELLALGESNRTVASTKMNTASSRSHQLFMVEIMQKFPNDTEKRGTLNLVDLAGCEKINQTGVTGNKLEEAKKINLSLSALGNVIKALTDKAEHIPYRDSKLTRLLQESLGGNYKTTLIVNCSPHPRNVEDSLNTLKFAQRAKTIKNKAVVNIKKSAEAYIRIIEELKKQLASTVKELDAIKMGAKTPPPPNIKKNEERSPLTNEELSLDTKFSEIKYEENLNIDELQETLNSLKQDQEYYASRIKELEEELDHERKRRLKTEKENFELTSKYNSLLDANCKNFNDDNEFKNENESLKIQVEILKFHLKTMAERFTMNLEKLKNGEKITEWEFTDMTQFTIDKNSRLPVYTEEDSLDVVNTSEYNIDIPINDTVLLSNDIYAQGLCQKIEDSSNVNKDLLIFEMKKQFIRSGIINSELTRGYYEILWKYKLLREKMNLRTKVINTQKERIGILEKMVLSLHNTYGKLVEIFEKLEKDQIKKDAGTDLGKGKIIRFVKPNVQPVQADKPVMRKVNRTGTAAPLQFLNRKKRNSLIANYDNLYEDHEKYLYLESNLQIQSLYNDQLKKSNEIITVERNSYKKLLDNLTSENSNVYAKEKDRWREFLDDFKDLCEKELVRKQLEINKLNELLGKWIHKYMELEDILGYKTKKKVLNESHKIQIEELLRQTKIHTRPTKLYMQESPLHCRFKSSISTHVSNISGDISPPSFD